MANLVSSAVRPVPPAFYVAALLLLSLPCLNSIIDMYVLRALHRVRVQLSRARAGRGVYSYNHESPPSTPHGQRTNCPSTCYVGRHGARLAKLYWQNIPHPPIPGGSIALPGTDTSPRVSSSTPGILYTHFYNHAHRLRLEKLLYLELSRSPNGFFKVLLDPGRGFTSETAARRF
jgi:hypothetical protein